jgi:hypothetical protein
MNITLTYRRSPTADRKEKVEAWVQQQMLTEFGYLLVKDVS